LGVYIPVAISSIFCYSKTNGGSAEGAAPKAQRRRRSGEAAAAKPPAPCGRAVHPQDAPTRPTDGVQTPYDLHRYISYFIHLSTTQKIYQ